MGLNQYSNVQTNGLFSYSFVDMGDYSADNNSLVRKIHSLFVFAGIKGMMLHEII